MAYKTYLHEQACSLFGNSLEELCLDIIIDNFQQFYCVFTSSKDARLQQNMQFLQRRYCNYLAARLLRNGKKTEKYFDFLINEHLSHIVFRWFHNSRYLNSIDDIFCRLPNLRIIEITSCGDKILESITKFCPKIVKVKMLSSVTDNGIKLLYERKNGMLPCPELKKIMIDKYKTSVTHEGAKCLIQSLPLVEKFDYPDLPSLLHSVYTENSFDPKKTNYFHLSKLDFSECKDEPHFTEILKACLTLCPNLKSVICILSTEEQLNVLSNSHLKELELDFSEKDPYINIDNFLKMSGRYLSFLSISNCAVSASALATHCPILESLMTVHINMTDDGNTQSKFQCLKEFFLYETTYAVIKIFRLISLSAPTLEHVIFSDCKLFSELQNDILSWCKSPLITNIDFMGIILEIDFLSDLLINCRSLNVLNMSYCKYDVHNPKEILCAIIDGLPNAPIIYGD